MNHFTTGGEVELRLITPYQPGGCACRAPDLGSQTWPLIAAITGKWGRGLFACFAHNLRGEVLNALRWGGFWTGSSSDLASLRAERGLRFLLCSILQMEKVTHASRAALPEPEQWESIPARG